MNDKELLALYRHAAADEYTRLRVGADNLDARLAELDAAGMHAVAAAAWDEGVRAAYSVPRLGDPVQPNPYRA